MVSHDDSRSPALSRAKCPARGESGSTIVETALSIGLLLTLIFGVLEVSLMLYTYHFVSYAAREATRYAIVRGSTCSGLSSACPASSTDIQNFVQGLGYPGIESGNMQVSTSWLSYSSSAVKWSTCGSCNTPGNQVQVTVTYQFPFSVPFIPRIAFGNCTPVGSVCLASTSAMVISQ